MPKFENKPTAATLRASQETAKTTAAERKQAEISKFKGESRSYSNQRPVRKVVSRYAR